MNVRNQSLRVTNLRALRLLKSLSQEQLAELAGVHVVTLNAIECGRKPLGPRVAKKLATFFDVPIEALEGRQELVADDMLPFIHTMAEIVAKRVMSELKARDSEAA